MGFNSAFKGLKTTVVSLPTVTETTWKDENHFKLVDHDDNNNDDNDNNSNIFKYVLISTGDKF
jgi:hypothetical protein